MFALANERHGRKGKTWKGCCIDYAKDGWSGIIPLSLLRNRRSTRRVKLYDPMRLCRLCQVARVEDPNSSHVTMFRRDHRCLESIAGSGTEPTTDGAQSPIVATGNEDEIVIINTKVLVAYN